VSKFKKYDKEDLFDLEEFLEEYMQEHEFLSFDGNGSNDVNDSNASNVNKSSDDFYNTLMMFYVKDLEILTSNMKPSIYQVISGSGPAWFLEPMSKTFIKTERGSEVVVIPGREDELGRKLVRTMNTFIMVPREEILDLGYN